MSLFDVDPFTLPDAPTPGERVSADRRLTIVNNGLLAARIHPATRVPLADNGETCGTCAHHQHLGHHDRSWHKCDVHRLGMSHSAASDVRVGWPACTKWEAQS